MKEENPTSRTSLAHGPGHPLRVMVRVKLFAAMRDAAGVDAVEIEARNVAEVAAGLRSLWPSAGQLIARSRFAVNHAFATMETAVSENDEIAVIPPVSGG